MGLRRSKTVKIAILQCDSVLQKFQAEFGNYPDMIISLLKHAHNELAFQVFDVTQNHYPEDIHEWDLYVMTGSKASVYDKDEWIQTLVRFVRVLDQSSKKVFGICFGHQVMALAKGGSVEKSEKGWGVGVASNRILLKAPWMSEEPSNLNLLVSHQDQVTRLPEDKTLLKDLVIVAESDFCPHFMVQWSSNLLSVQGHPEWQKGYSRALVNERRHIIPGQRVEEALESLGKSLDNCLVAQWVLNFANGS